MRSGELFRSVELALNAGVAARRGARRSRPARARRTDHDQAFSVLLSCRPRPRPPYRALIKSAVERRSPRSPIPQPYPHFLRDTRDPRRTAQVHTKLERIGRASARSGLRIAPKATGKSHTSRFEMVESLERPGLWTWIAGSGSGPGRTATRRGRKQK